MMRITIERKGLATVGRRGFQEAGRRAIYAAGFHWWKVFLPLHFTNIAYLRYRYASRDKRTSQYKRDRKPWPFGENTAPAIGEVLPLVFTGRSRQASLNKMNIQAKAPNYETYRVDVILDAPAFNFGAHKRINMRDEVTRFTPQEEKTLDNIFSEDWNKQLNRLGLAAPKRTRRIAA